jgi:acyl-CoA synthetase (NDP forming)
MKVLQPLLIPRSIAVVGASAARPTAGTAVIANLKTLGYGGAVYPVNPKYDDVDGLRCYPSLAAVPGEIDVVFLGVPAEGTVALVDECGGRGIRTVVITASGFADAGPGGAALQSRLVDVAAAYDIAVCGPNNMGVVNWLDGAGIWTGTLTPPQRTGPVGVISQSGSVSMLCAADDRNIGLGIIIGSGNEAVLTSAEYLDALVRDDRIRIVLHFVESIKRPRAYAAAADDARRRGKAIVVLKVGRTERGRQATVAHTGSLAGPDEEFDAFCRRHDLIRVTSLDEMLELAELFTKAGRAPRRAGACLIAMSGGEVALLSDQASDAGLPLPEFAPDTKASLATVFPPYTTIANPLDAWGAGWNPDAHRAAVAALMRDPSIGVIACAIDPDARNGRANTPVSRDMAEIHRGLLAEAGPDGPPIVFFNNISAALSPVIGGALEGSGIAYLQGAQEALRAIAHWTRFHTAPRGQAQSIADAAASRAEDAGAPRAEDATPPRAVDITAARPGASVTPPPPPALATLLASARHATVDERGAAPLLAAYGIPTVKSALARTAAEAVRHAAAIGYPVALKAASPGLPHKSDIGGVALNVRSAAQVRAAFKDIVARVRHARPELSLDGVLVAEMASAGLEMILGVSVGPYGPVVVVGSGGIDVEARRDVAYALAPVDADEAGAMLKRLHAYPLLEASRGRPARDLEALVAMIVNLSRLAVDCAPWLAAVDLNPVIVGDAGRGAVAVDALLVLPPS